MVSLPGWRPAKLDRYSYATRDAAKINPTRPCSSHLPGCDASSLPSHSRPHDNAHTIGTDHMSRARKHRQVARREAETVRQINITADGAELFECTVRAVIEPVWLVDPDAAFAAYTHERPADAAKWREVCLTDGPSMAADPADLVRYCSWCEGRGYCAPGWQIDLPASSTPPTANQN